MNRDENKSQERPAPGPARSEGVGKHDVSQQDDERFWADIDERIGVLQRQQLAVNHLARGPVQSQKAWEAFDKLKDSVVAPVGGGPAEVRDKKEHG